MEHHLYVLLEVLGSSDKIVNVHAVILELQGIPYLRENH